MAADVHTTESAIARFLRSGRLPFLGREQEAERIAGFVRAATDSHELRIAIVLAEAGMGKSRLVEETLPLLEKGGTVLLHAKLYPEGATAIPPLLADALEKHPATQTLLRQAPEQSISGVANALRRIVRLRPTVIFLEDLHLLAEDSLREFTRLLETLADEPISLICLARPQEFRARGVVERWTVETIELRPLGRDRLSEMWLRLFGFAPSEETTDILATATRGNMLALRSVVRGLLSANAIVNDGGERWRNAVSLSDFRKVVRHAVELVVEGMVAHIDERLLERAEQLATLGEVFSATTARSLLEQADDTIEALQQAGILVVPTAVLRPIISADDAERESRESLYAFSHSLLHQYLVDRQQVDPSRLLSIIAAQEALYSFLPLTLLQAHATALRVDRETMRKAYTTLYTLAYHVNTTTDWELTANVLELAASLPEHYRDAWDEEERRTLGIDLLSLRATIDSRTATGVDRDLLEELLEATRSPQNDLHAVQRTDAIYHILHHHFLFEPSRLALLAAEVHTLFAEFPTLRTIQTCIGTLNGLAFVTFSANLHDAFMRTWDILHGMIDDLSLNEKLRAQAVFNLASIARLRGETEAMIAEQHALLARARQEMHHLKAHGYEEFFQMNELIDLAKTGRFRDFFNLYDGVVDKVSMLGRWQNVLALQCYRLQGRAGFGAEMDEIERGILEVVEQLPPAHPTVNRVSTAMWPIYIGVLRNQPQWARRIIGQILHPGEEAPGFAMLLLESIEGNTESIRARLTAGITRIEDNLYALIAPLFGVGDPPGGTGAWEEEIRSRLGTAYISIQGYNGLLLLLHALRLAASDYSALCQRLLPDMQRALRNWMEWMAERGLSGFMAGVLEQFASLLPPKESTALRARIAAIRGEQQNGGVTSDRIRISLLGSIRFAPPGEDFQPLKGVRIRTMLALMAANSMLKQPLSPREFLTIAADDELDYELARKKRNMGVVRLREALGADAVLTDGETPQLNLVRVEVDLLEAHRRIESIREALRERSLVRAATGVLELLAITRGEVAFPTLYQEFFEAAREEFEVRVRHAVLKTAEALEREEDWERAEELLRGIVEMMPEDEEMLERLADVLERSGNKLEAARLRLSSTVEV